MQEQVLDSMDLEREKGRHHQGLGRAHELHRELDGETYEMNLIDTPGHVDFAYEVSRALQGCEGAILVVDATQGIEAQTLANLYLADEADLEIAAGGQQDRSAGSASPDDVAKRSKIVTGTRPKTSLPSAPKMGTNIREVLESVILNVPPPHGDLHQPPAAR
jgi:GTP-binding protein LepA